MNYLFVLIVGIGIGYQIQFKLRSRLVKRFKNLLDDYYELCKKKQINNSK